MINKKNVLGKIPDELGIKDAIHTAIVSVRAACPIKPGSSCSLNEYNEAVPDSKGLGVADPFLKKMIQTGQNFWLILNQDAVPNVRHVWEHPEVNFDPPTRECQGNKYLFSLAHYLGITYEELMQYCTSKVNGYPNQYSGPLENPNDIIDSWELWTKWASEVGYEFTNQGTECCPQYDYPSELFDD